MTGVPVVVVADDRAEARQPLKPQQIRTLDALYGSGTIKSQDDLAGVIGARIETAMGLNGVPGQVVADMIGHRNGTQLSLWRKGERMPPVLPLILLASALNVPVDYLLGLADEPERDIKMAARTQIARMVQQRLESAVASVVDEVHDEMTKGLPVRDAWQRTMAGLIGLLEALSMLRLQNADSFDGDLRGGSRVVSAAQALVDAISSLDHRAGLTDAIRGRVMAASSGICDNQKKA